MLSSKSRLQRRLKKPLKYQTRSKMLDIFAADRLPLPQIPGEYFGKTLLRKEYSHLCIVVI
jgi:hypothetical protein